MEIYGNHLNSTRKCRKIYSKRNLWCLSEHCNKWLGVEKKVKHAVFVLYSVCEYDLRLKKWERIWKRFEIYSTQLFVLFLLISQKQRNTILYPIKKQCLDINKRYGTRIRKLYKLLQNLRKETWKPKELFEFLPKCRKTLQ